MTRRLLQLALLISVAGPLVWASMRAGVVRRAAARPVARAQVAAEANGSGRPRQSIRTSAFLNHPRDLPELPDWASDVRLEIKSWESVEGLPKKIAVFETVFWEPDDTKSLRELINGTDIVRGKKVLEIGTGSGLLALCCLRAGAERVVATDVNRAALCNAIYNAHILGVAGRLEVRPVPLDDAGAFSVVSDSETFDLIVSNPPWENGDPEAIDRYAYYDRDFRLLRSILQGLHDHLKPDGRVLLAYGSVDAISTLKRLAPRYGVEVAALDHRTPESLPEVFLPGMLLEVRPRRSSAGTLGWRDDSRPHGGQTGPWMRSGADGTSLGAAEEWLPHSGEGKSHFRCARIGTVPN